MASPLYPSSSNNPSSPTTVVTREEFNCFHTIDRTLFTRLVFDLNRDLDQSFWAMGFLMLLEQSNYAGELVACLVSLPDAFIDAVANEVSVCINVLYNQDFASTLLAANNDDNSVIPLLLRMTEERLTLRLLNQNRQTFCDALTKIWNEFCARAFKDIYESAERHRREKLKAIEREKFIEDMNKLSLGGQQESPNRLSVQQVTIASRPPPNRLSAQQVKIASPPPNRQSAPQVTIASPSPPPPPPVEEEADKAAAEKRLAEEEKAVVVEADDRTVFLTFSKGYPISEEEVRIFFTRRFGDIIDAIEMQEVEENEQPLYAKMVLKLRYASMLEVLVSARARNKFTINGKHVWARKYVRKNPIAASSSTHI